MPAAASGRLLLHAALIACSLVACAAATSSGVSSPRPAVIAKARPLSVVASRKIDGLDCVRIEDMAAYLGLKLTRTEKGRIIALAGAGARAELAAGTRDIRVNGLRVFLGHPVRQFRGHLYVTRIDFERCLAPMLRPGHGVAAMPAPRTIVLDPGHGGRDHGKVNDQLKVNEKTFTLDTALRLKKLLEADGFRVVLTREDDRFLELAQRPAAANAAGGDLFISIHFNALQNDRRTSGVEVFTFAPQHQRSTEAWMPGQKDDTEHVAQPANRYDYWNSLLAHSIQGPFVRNLKVSDRGKKLMHAGVLRSLRCPGVLVECGFLTSDVEARKIATPEYRQQLAETLRLGIRNYVNIVASLRPKTAAGTTSAGHPASHSS